MTDILATFFRFKQFIFEYTPFFLAAWLGVAVVTGLTTAALRRRLGARLASSPFLKRSPLRWLWQLLLALLWQPGREIPALNFSGWHLFSLTASVPGLVAVSIISAEAVWLRLTLAALFALALSRFSFSVVLRRKGNPEGQPPETGTASPDVALSTDSTLPRERQANIIQVIWRSFSGQVERAVIPLIIGFGLASALTIYVPAYTIQPWLGEDIWAGPYLAAVLVTPLQLMGGAEVILASALLVKGTSLGTALSIMLAAPAATLSMLRHVRSTRKARTVALYLVAVWVTAGTLGAAVNGIGRLLDVWR